MVNTPYQRTILSALQGDKHVYAGTVPAATVQRRRAKNRMARRTRAAQRRAA